jgi:aryl-alcohol dehydrogenase-like predicted oxidoreductase
VLRQPNVASALVGASRPDQIEANVKAVEVELSQDMLEKIEKILA